MTSNNTSSESSPQQVALAKAEVLARENDPKQSLGQILSDEDMGHRIDTLLTRVNLQLAQFKHLAEFKK